MTCVNLRAMFGDRYLIGFDPSYSPKGVPRAKLDPWYMTIPCRGRGVTIYPHGGDMLAVEVNGRRNLATMVGAIPGVVLWQDGFAEETQEGKKWIEVTFIFPLALFPAVAKVVKPRRRPVLTAEHRAACSRNAARARGYLTKTGSK